MDQTQATAQTRVTAQVLFLNRMGKAGFLRIGDPATYKSAHNPQYYIRKDRVPPEVWERWRSLTILQEVTIVYNLEQLKNVIGGVAYHVIDIL